MTLQEICQKYGVSENSMKNQFARTVEKIRMKHGVLIEKSGRGASATYTETYLQALTYDDEQNRVENFPIVLEALSLAEWQFLVLLCVLSSPFGVFRGNARTFLEYYRMGATDSRIKEIEIAVQELTKNEWIDIIYDKSTDEGFFTLYVKRAMEKELIVKFPQIQACRKIMDKHKQRSFIPLLKVWLATEELQKVQPYTVAQLEAMTGLSEYTIRKTNKILQEEEIMQMHKVYADQTTCLGREVDINAFIPNSEG